MSAIHKDRRYVKAARIIRLYANADPRAVCWRDGWTLAEHQAKYPDRNITWHAGHLIDGSTNWWPWFHVTIRPPEGDWLAPEASCCNIAAGNDARHIEPTTETW